MQDDDPPNPSPDDLPHNNPDGDPDLEDLQRQELHTEILGELGDLRRDFNRLEHRLEAAAGIPYTQDTPQQPRKPSRDPLGKVLLEMLHGALLGAGAAALLELLISIFTGGL